MDKFRVGIIGAGGIAAKLHLPELTAIPDVEVAVISGRKESRLNTLCHKFNVPRWTNDYDSVLADPNIDAVVIALPHPLHVEFGLKALAAGKHVHMQKPLSTSLKEADAFVQATEQSDRCVLALPFVSVPHLLAARQLVQQGAIGNVSSARSRFSHGGPEVYYATIQNILDEQPDDALWFFDSEQADVGAVFDMGVYAIAHLVTILGSAKNVTAVCSTIDKPTTLEDTAVIILEFENGAIGTAETGWCDAARTYDFSVHGTTGKLVNPNLSDRLLMYRPSSSDDEDAPLVESAIDTSKFPVENSHQHWVNCIGAGQQPEFANVHSARHVTEIMMLVIQSSKEGRKLPVTSRVTKSK